MSIHRYPGEGATEAPKKEADLQDMFDVLEKRSEIVLGLVERMDTVLRGPLPRGEDRPSTRGYSDSGAIGRLTTVEVRLIEAESALERLLVYVGNVRPTGVPPMPTHERR